MIVVKKFSPSSDENKNQWNLQLDKCCNKNVFALYEWGQFKSQSWSVERFCFYNEQTFVGQAQILFKKVGPFKLGWCASGINITDYRYLSEIVHALASYFNLRTTYIRFNFLDDATGENRFAFDEIEILKKVNRSVNSGYTIRFHDLKTVEIDPSSYDRNNRYYLKKALSKNLRYEFKDLDVELFCKVHDSMVETKKLSHLKISNSDIRQLHQYYGNMLKMANVYLDEATVASCLIIQYKDIAYYYLAGASEQGRDMNASFFMVDSLLQGFKGQGVAEFDFGGITPFKKEASGVNRFKMGFHGKVVNYVGERVLCGSKTLKLVFDYLISKKL